MTLCIKRTIRLAFGVFALLAVSSSGLVLAADQVVWRLGHTLSVPGVLYDKIITYELPARINKASGGLVRVQPIVGVVRTDDVLNALQQGRVEMGDLTVAYSAATYPLWAVLNLPGLVDDVKQIAPIAQKIVLPVMAEDMAKWGIRPIIVGGWDGGGFFSNKRITTAKDFAGLKWRTHAPMLSKQITELGGATIGMPFEELYPSLERRLVDAYTTVFPAVHATHLSEVTKYAIVASGGTSLWVVMVSDQALNKLPADVRMKVVAELEAINNEVGDRLYNEYVESFGKLQKAGVEIITLSKEENQKLIDAAKKAVWPEWLKQTGDRGQRLMNQIQSFKP